MPLLDALNRLLLFKPIKTGHCHVTFRTGIITPDAKQESEIVRICSIMTNVSNLEFCFKCATEKNVKSLNHFLHQRCY